MVVPAGMSYEFYVEHVLNKGKDNENRNTNTNL